MGNKESSENGGHDRVLRDEDVAGGAGRRQFDEFLSKNLGGYKSDREELSVYGKRFEPALHAAEHAARSFMYDNEKEMARAKDEMKAALEGKGLREMDNKYQREYTEKQKESD